MPHLSSSPLGQQPGVPGQRMSATGEVQGQLSDPPQFGAIVLRAQAGGAAVRLRDVARIELGAQGYGSFSRLNGQPSAGIGVQLAPTGNAQAAADVIKARMLELKALFPAGHGLHRALGGCRAWGAAAANRPQRSTSHRLFAP